MKRLIPLLALLLPALPGLAETAVVDPATTDFGYCITCHGVNGRGNPGVDAPRIGGMAAWTIEAQLRAFRKGWRGTHPEDIVGADMHAMSLAIDDTQVAGVSAWFAAMDPPAAPDTVEGDPIRGQALYAACAICHGAAAEGNQGLEAPALAGQSDWYLVRQLELFASGLRGYAEGDTLGAQMRGMVTTLPDDDAIRDVVAYINSID